MSCDRPFLWRGQRGQAAIITLLLVIGIGASIIVYNFPTPAKHSIERDRITADALAQAKAALIAYAVDMRLDLAGPTPRVGDLPCPDLVNSGNAGTSCSNAGGTTIGRLPWRSLGLPDLRDGHGERLWYAVSENFKNNPAIGTLNSDSYGTITVRDRNGTIMNDGTFPPADVYSRSGVIAVIFAPGPVLTRQGAASPQDRSCTGDSNMAQCQTTGVCSSAATPLCNPVNYLDRVGPPVLTVTGATDSSEDNANFVDYGSVNGFINGDISNGDIPIVNDRLLTITYNDLVPMMERRVAREVLKCLNDYATVPQNGGRYPWAAPVAGYPSYADQTGVRFGRIPDTFNATLLGVGGLVASAVCPDPLLGPLFCMTTNWPASCSLNTGTWWSVWKELVFYGVAEAYQPGDPTGTILSPGPIAPGGPCGSCLQVSPPSANFDKRVVVAVAGKRLSAAAYAIGNNQPRTIDPEKRDPTNYLEGTNDNPTNANTYEQQPITSSFSDRLVYQQ